MKPSTSLASIRRALASDASEVSSLIEKYVASGALLPRSPEFCAERALEFLVAVAEGRVVGCVHLDEYSPSLAEIRSLVVDPDWQSRGIGSSLVRAVEHLARVREYDLLFAVSNNEPFFLSQGYAPRHIPELDKQRNQIMRFKGVYAKEIAGAGRP